MFPFIFLYDRDSTILKIRKVHISRKESMTMCYVFKSMNALKKWVL